jgi:small subunit ribosomal protein S13
MAENDDFRHIVRIASKDLNGNLPVYRALTKIKGLGIRMAKNMATVFEKETKVGFGSKLGSMPEEMDKKLEDIVLFPEKHGIPKYCLNRQRDLETGQDKHQVMADLDFQLRTDLQRLNKIKSYRGLRLSWGLPVRGQRTKSTHRGKGGAVGVTKKDAKGGASQPAKKAELAKQGKKK